MTKALEIGTGERLAKVEQQLAAANVLIAEQNKLGKERQEWALHTSDVIRSLNQQLAGALEQNLVLSKQTDHTILDLSNYVDSLEQQLAAAIAACKLKDAALQNCEGMLDELRDYPVTHDAIIEALAIQPDDSALKAWLGEPVAYCDLPGRLKYTISRLTRYSNSPEWIKVGTALYSPKELK